MYTHAHTLFHCWGLHCWGFYSRFYQWAPVFTNSLSSRYISQFCLYVVITYPEGNRSYTWLGIRSQSGGAPCPKVWRISPTGTASVWSYRGPYLQLQLSLSQLNPVRQVGETRAKRHHKSKWAETVPHLCPSLFHLGINRHKDQSCGNQTVNTESPCRIQNFLIYWFISAASSWPNSDYKWALQSISVSVSERKNSQTEALSKTTGFTEVLNLPLSRMPRLPRSPILFPWAPFSALTICSWTSVMMLCNISKAEKKLKKRRALSRATHIVSGLPVCRSSVSFVLHTT